MIVTNLLDKVVKIKNLPKAGEVTIGKICAVYGETSMTVAIIAEDGQIYSGLQASLIVVCNQREFEVIVFWQSSEKIKAIKAVRAITGISLREAKDLVESKPNCFTLKNNLTHEEAGEIKRRLWNEEQMECEVRKMLMI